MKMNDHAETAVLIELDVEHGRIQTRIGDHFEKRFSSSLVPTVNEVHSGVWRCVIVCDWRIKGDQLIGWFELRRGKIALFIVQMMSRSSENGSHDG